MMRVLLTSYCLWIIFISPAVKGQANCLRTNRQASRKCATGCNPSTGCDGALEECLCDGDCGYSCVQKDLSCGRPSGVARARVQYQSTSFGAVVRYTCYPGYTLSGASQRTCRAIGKWDAVGPNCVQMCSTPRIPFSTYIASPVNYSRTYRTGERIILACKKGFKKLPGGNPIKICISGRWTQFPFKCEGTHSCRRTIRPARTKCTQECSPEIGCGSADYLCLCDGSCGYSCVQEGMSCGSPPAISHGQLNLTGTSYNDTAHYGCDKGYSLNTDPVKRCTAKKRWSGLTPRCLKDCGDPATPKNAIISNPSHKYPSGYKVIFKCNEGYHQEGMSTQMCFQGQWTVLPFKCSEGSCGDPGTPENGLKVGVIFSVNSKVYFDCDLGYELVGSEERKCQRNGTWTGRQPVCRGMFCGNPPAISHGQLKFTGTSYNDWAHYTCDDGYSLNTHPVKRCTAKKRWSGLIPRCLKDCGDPATPKNAIISNPSHKYPSGYKVIFKCNEGFNQEGMSTQMCFLGQWTVLPFKCSEGGCRDPGTPENGRKLGRMIYSVNSNVYFDCDLGYELVGSEKRKCQQKGTWTGRQPVCRGMFCGNPPAISHGQLKFTGKSYNDWAHYTCDDGYSLNTHPVKRCTAKKRWSGLTPRCLKDCGDPATPKNAIISNPSHKYPSGYKVIFKCNEGFNQEGMSTQMCFLGQWTVLPFKCSEGGCRDPGTPENGRKLGRMIYSVNRNVYFDCDLGYELVGSEKRKCQQNGTWTGRQPVCRASVKGRQKLSGGGI